MRLVALLTFIFPILSVAVDLPVLRLNKNSFVELKESSQGNPLDMVYQSVDGKKSFAIFPANNAFASHVGDNTSLGTKTLQLDVWVRFEGSSQFQRETMKAELDDRDEAEPWRRNPEMWGTFMNPQEAALDEFFRRERAANCEKMLASSKGSLDW